jgi:hypothetical protein
MAGTLWTVSIFMHLKYLILKTIRKPLIYLRILCITILYRSLQGILLQTFFAFQEAIFRKQNGFVPLQNLLHSIHSTFYNHQCVKLIYMIR